MEPRRRAIVKEFYANLGERKDLTCYVRGRWTLLGKGPSPKSWGSDKLGSEQSMSSSKKAQASKRLTENSGMV